MRRLMIIGLFVLLSCSHAYGHNGSIGLYADASLNNCSGYYGYYSIDSVYVFYVRGQGPNLGKEVDFRLQLSSPDMTFSQTVVWSPRVKSTVGDIQTGISLRSDICMGMNEAVVPLGLVIIFNTSYEWITSYLSVVPHPSSGMISIGECDPPETIVPVPGGVFVFNGACNVGVKTSSWGAIKSLYQ
jgi:hypothetical protein